MRAETFIATSGYQYKRWKGDFYPKKLQVKEWFEYYTRFFNTVEINNTFYKMADAESFKKWRKAAPKNFCYSLKYSRYGTHRKS